jgi:hypothetical protein
LVKVPNSVPVKAEWGEGLANGSHIHKLSMPVHDHAVVKLVFGTF